MSETTGRSCPFRLFSELRTLVGLDCVVSIISRDNECKHVETYFMTSGAFFVETSRSPPQMIWPSLSSRICTSLRAPDESSTSKSIKSSLYNSINDPFTLYCHAPPLSRLSSSAFAKMAATARGMIPMPFVLSFGSASRSVPVME